MVDEKPLITESQVSNTMTREYLVAMARGQIEPIYQSGKGVFFTKGKETFRLVFKTSYEAGRFFTTVLDMGHVIKDANPQFARAATNEEIEAIREGRIVLYEEPCYFCQHPKRYHLTNRMPCDFQDIDVIDGETPVPCLCYGWCETKEEADKLATETPK